MINLSHIQTAQSRISKYIRKTPLELSTGLSAEFGAEINLKLENWQKTGSFKLRGALNKVLSLSDEEKQQGVVTASAGNHALGVAYAAQLLNIKTKIVVPENASAAKVNALRNYDMELIKKGVDYDDSEEYAWLLQKQEGLTFIHAFSDPEIIAGQGTIALEILDDLPDVKTIIVPIGGGGLISGIAVAAKSVNPKVKIIGVQSEASPAMFDALRAGKVVESPIHETIADGLAGRFVTELTLNYVQQYVDDVILVSETSVKSAVQKIFEAEHFIVEGSAAVGLAAVMENKIKGKSPITIIVTGRNISSDLVKKLL